MSTSSAFTLHTSFSPLLPLYSTFLLDQFGVIHNGSRSLHGAVDCIQSMLHQEKKLAILSNTSSPSHVALKRLKKYDLREDMFAGGLVSSGEECAKFVREHYTKSNGNKEGGGDGRAMKALWFTWRDSETQNPLQFLSYCENGAQSDDNFDKNRGEIGVAETVEEADFILLHGSEVWRRCRDLTVPNEDTLVQDLRFLYDKDFSAIDSILEAAAERNLPCVCANPDFIVGLPGGVVGNMPGKIAERYEQLGGRVTHFGKPNPRHFHACLENLCIDFDSNAKIAGVAHVGDSLEHDVAGANAAGIDSVFVLGGIHAKELGLVQTGSEEGGVVILEDDDDNVPGVSSISKNELTTKLHRFFDEKGIWPTHVIPSLSLGPSDNN